jgi:hypothetical protein
MNPTLSHHKLGTTNRRQIEIVEAEQATKVWQRYLIPANKLMEKGSGLESLSHYPNLAGRNNVRALLKV